MLSDLPPPKYMVLFSQTLLPCVYKYTFDTITMVLMIILHSGVFTEYYKYLLNHHKYLTL